MIGNTKKIRLLRHLDGSALPVVIVVSTIMLLMVAGLFYMLNGSNLVLRQINLQRFHINNIESAFLLYCRDSAFVCRLNPDSSFVLYDSIPQSAMFFKLQQWGMYEKVSIQDIKGYICSVRLIGNRFPFKENGSLYYADNGSGLAVAGASVLEGDLYVPPRGISCKQIKWEFFSGTEPRKSQINTISNDTLPAPLQHMRNYTDSILSNRNGYMHGYDGNVIAGDRLFIDSSCAIAENSLVIARTIIVADSMQLTAQLFALDSIIIGNGVVLKYPSGLFVYRKNRDRYMEIGKGSIINGYAIVDGENTADVLRPNFMLKKGAVLRGLAYINGVAQMHGTVNGSALMNNSVLYTDNEYYNHTLYDFILLENKEMAYPVWLESHYEKKEAIWIN